MAELTTLARPYARAAFEVALGAGDLQGWSRMLNEFAAVSRVEKVADALSSPSLTGQQQAGILISLCGEDLDAQAKNFIKVLSENRRLALLPEIVTLFEALKADQEKTVDVDVLTAYPLSDETRDKLAEALKRRLQREVNLRSEVDKDLIGGVVLRAGDLVIDGSVRGKLNKLAEAMNS